MLAVALTIPMWRTFRIKANKIKIGRGTKTRYFDGGDVDIRIVSFRWVQFKDNAGDVVDITNVVDTDVAAVAFCFITTAASVVLAAVGILSNNSVIFDNCSEINSPKLEGYSCVVCTWPCGMYVELPFTLKWSDTVNTESVVKEMFAWTHMSSTLALEKLTWHLL